jgi:hypothetical protein
MVNLTGMAADCRQAVEKWSTMMAKACIFAVAYEVNGIEI